MEGFLYVVKSLRIDGILPDVAFVSSSVFQIPNKLEWMNEWMNEWLNEWMNEQTNEWLNEWMNKLINQWMNEWMNE